MIFELDSAAMDRSRTMESGTQLAEMLVMVVCDPVLANLSGDTEDLAVLRREVSYGTGNEFERLVDFLLYVSG